MIFKLSFEDVLPFIIGVGWIILSAILGGKKKRKKTNAVKIKNNKSYPDPMLDSLLKEWSGRKKVEKEKKKKVEISNKERNTQNFNYDSRIETVDYKEKRAKIKNMGEEKFQPKQNKISGKRHDFDLKKAFIYSEILKRKYI